MKTFENVKRKIEGKKKKYYTAFGGIKWHAFKSGWRYNSDALKGVWKFKACLVSVFKNSFLFLRTQNTQNIFDKRVFFVPMCSPCFLKLDFQRTKKRCFSCFCHCSKKIKKTLFFDQCSHLFTVKENSLHY